MLLERPIATDGFGRKRVGVNRRVEFSAKNLKTADMVAMLMGKQNPIELLRGDAALFEAQANLTRAQPAIDKKFAVIGCDQRTVPGAAAPEHRHTEHAGI